MINPGPGIGQAQQCSGIKPVDWILIGFTSLYFLVVKANMFSLWASCITTLFAFLRVRVSILLTRGERFHDYTILLRVEVCVHKTGLTPFIASFHWSAFTKAWKYMNFDLFRKCVFFFNFTWKQLLIFKNVNYPVKKTFFPRSNKDCLDIVHIFSYSIFLVVSVSTLTWFIRSFFLSKCCS